MHLVRWGVVALFAALALPNPAQAFELSIGGPDTDAAYSVAQTADGGFVAGGFYQNGYLLELYVVKARSSGVIQWDTRVSGLGWKDIAYDLVPSSDGSVLVIGSAVLPSVGTRPVLVKLNAAGEVIWTTEDGISNLIPAASGIVHGFVRSDGSIVIGGGSNSMSNPIDPWLAEITAEGELTSFHSYPPLFGPGFGVQTYVNDLSPSADGGLVVTGYAAGPTRGYVWKLDPQFATEWVVDLGATSFLGTANSIDLAANGDYVVTGSHGPNGLNTQIVRVDPSGGVVWSYDLVHPDGWYSSGRDVVERNDGTLALLESSIEAIGSPVYRSAVLHVDGESGEVIDRFEVTVADSSTAMSAGAPTADGGYILAGSTNQYTNYASDLAMVLVEPEFFRTTDPAAVDLGGDGVELLLGPNPASRTLWIRSESEIVVARIYDVRGRLVLTAPAAGTTATIDVSSLRAGAHWALLVTRDGIAVRKLLIQR
ncbi:MAG: T9SS type A sorting domain-containing protein [Candidatus Eisenbacteria bacterium]|nr:T9SS type A sorting domain-containing protein [Candidatus Eisenbacteria bacterium]